LKYKITRSHKDTSLGSLQLVLQAFAEPLLEQGQLGDEVRDSVHECILRGVVGGSLNSENNLVLQGVGVLVARKQYIGVLQQLHSNHVP
jgi:hypothetical protein